MITTAEAFAGPWALNVRGWLWILVPTAAVIVVQGLATPSLTPAWIAASTVLQLLTVSAWSIAVVGVSRLRTGRVVPLASGLLWVGNGVVHGLVGGAVAAAAGTDPEWGYRFSFWIVAAATWMPPITYALAQWDHYRTLLAERARVRRELAHAVERAEEDADARERRFTAVVSDALHPALQEIRAQLRENGARIDAPTAHTIAARLDDLARRADRFTEVRPVEAPETRPTRVSVAEAAVDFELSRPVFAALLSAALITTPLLAEAYRGGGWEETFAMLAAVVVSTTVLAIGFALLRPLSLGGRERSLLSRLAVGVAGLTGAGVLWALDGMSLDARAILLLVLYPAVQMLAASLMATAVALSAANVETEEGASAERAALEHLRERALAAEEETAARLHTLLRGELNGRLAACAMMLAFLADGGATDSARADVVTKVLEQLDAAVGELRAR